MAGIGKGGPAWIAGPPGNQVPLVCPMSGSTVEIALSFKSLTSLHSLDFRGLSEKVQRDGSRDD